MATQVAGYVGKVDPGNGTQYAVGSTAYGVCDTAADTAAKVVDMTGFTLLTGATIHVKFTNDNSAASPTLNVNGTGAKPILLATSAASYGWDAGATLALTYDGAGWVQANSRCLASKTFTGVIGTANNWANATFFFGSVKPDSYYQLWRIRYRVIATIGNTNEGKSICDIEFCGSKSAIVTYKCMNSIQNTSYRPSYYHEIYWMKEAGFTNGYGHALGERLYSAYLPTTAANARTYTIEIYECNNCEFTFYDSMLKYANIPGTGSTNYSSYTEYDAINNGLRETGDDNTLQDVEGYFGAKTGDKGIWAGGLCLRNANGLLENICTGADGTVTASSRTTAKTKLANTDGFMVGSPVFYTTTTYNAATNIGNNVIYNSYALTDTRYAFNTELVANCLTPYLPIYLVGTVASDGLYYLDTVWWTQTPTDTSKVYILVGGVYDSTTSNCRFSLYQHNLWLVYDGTKLRQYKGTVKAQNVSVTFVLDTSQSGSYTYEDYPYRASYANALITSDMMPVVAYSLDQATGQKYAPVCETYNGGIYLYSAEAGTVTIPSISAF